MKRMIGLILLLSVLMSGCATIMTGTTQPLSINSNVSGAKVYVDGVYKGSTPMILDLKTKRNHTIKIEAEGYEPYTELIRKETSGWVFGNILLGGFIGLGVDLFTGGLYVFDKENVSGDMHKKEIGKLTKK